MEVPKINETKVDIPHPLASSAVLSIDSNGKSKTAGDNQLSNPEPITDALLGKRISNISFPWNSCQK